MSPNLNIYLNNPWKPVKYSFFIDEQLCSQVYEMGYAKVSFLNPEQLKELNELYTETHNIQQSNGGMFYSVYSNDIAYRKKIFSRINEILTPSFQKYFKDFRVVMNSFVVKASGPKSEFYVHQDSSGLDETQYSCISLWIPLHNIGPDNGAMAVMEKSHSLFSPYRGISFKAPFDNIHGAVKKYLKPVFMEAGEALFFDNRLVHNSLANSSGKNRVVATCGIFPVEAKIITCFKNLPGDDIELIAHDDEFMTTYPKFLNGCFDRPDDGQTVGFIKDNYPLLTETELDALCNAKGIAPVYLIDTKSVADCNMIGEPNQG